MVMRIKNLTKKMRMSKIILPIFYGYIPSFPFFLGMIAAEDFTFNILPFINAAKTPETKLILVFMLIIAPIIGWGFTVKALFDRQGEIKKLYSGVHLKEVYLSSNNIQFSFYKPQYNFSCGYNDVEKVELVIETKHIVTKHRYEYRDEYILENLRYYFTLSNGKTLWIEKPASWGDEMKKIYDFIRHIYGKVGDFNYRAIGSGDNFEVENEINYFLRGRKNKR